MRAAIYFTPDEHDPLTSRAAEWLGRDAFRGAPTRAADRDIDPMVADPARYGFHATLKAPFRLADGSSLEQLNAALAEFSRHHAAVPLGTLELGRIGNFFALMPGEIPDALAVLEDRVRMQFEPFRAPLNDAEIARRAPAKLSDRQRAGLERWGYPFIGPDFRFHITLTGPLPGLDQARAEANLRDRFSDVLARPVFIDALSLFIEPDAGSPFHVHARHKLCATALD